MRWLNPNPFAQEELRAPRVAEFILHWDRGTYNVKRNWKFLQKLFDVFPYDGIVYRGGKTRTPVPPVSWTKDLETLRYYFTHIWGRRVIGRPYSIPAWKSDVVGIDVEKIALWFIEQRPQSKDRFRAERLASFREVLTLVTPHMDPIGTLVQTPKGVVLRS